MGFVKGGMSGGASLEPRCADLLSSKYKSPCERGVIFRRRLKNVFKLWTQYIIILPNTESWRHWKLSRDFIAICLVIFVVVLFVSRYLPPIFVSGRQFGYRKRGAFTYLCRCVCFHYTRAFRKISSLDTRDLKGFLKWFSSLQTRIHLLDCYFKYGILWSSSDPVHFVRSKIKKSGGFCEPSDPVHFCMYYLNIFYWDQIPYTVHSRTSYLRMGKALVWPKYMCEEISWPYLSFPGF